ncbi:MAG: hypothetical protein LBS86_04660, partial [Treponema sp.]|nr:hypothetical protein [Treponema sp.]
SKRMLWFGRLTNRRSKEPPRQKTLSCRSLRQAQRPCVEAQRPCVEAQRPCIEAQQPCVKRSDRVSSAATVCPAQRPCVQLSDRVAKRSDRQLPL